MALEDASKKFLSRISTVEADLGPGPIAHDEFGNVYIKCFTGGLGIGDAVGVTGGAQEPETFRLGGAGDYLVPCVTATGSLSMPIGWNQTGVTVPIFTYFWVRVGPVIDRVITTGDIGDAIYPGAGGFYTNTPTAVGSVGVLINTPSGSIGSIIRA